MGKSSKKYIVGYKYKFGMHAIFGVKPIDRILRWYADGKILHNTPASGGTISINKPKIFSAAEISDGMVGAVSLHLNGTPQFDEYLQDNYPVAASLVPRFDKWAHAVFKSDEDFTDSTIKLDTTFDYSGSPGGTTIVSVVNLETLFSAEVIDAGLVSVDSRFRVVKPSGVVITASIAVNYYTSNDASLGPNGSSSDNDSSLDGVGDVAVSSAVPVGTRSIGYSANYTLSAGEGPLPESAIEENFFRVSGPAISDEGPFYFGNNPRPRPITVIAERAETTCPFANNTLTYTDVAGNTVNDFNPVSMYWELFIKGTSGRYGTTFSAAADTVFSEGLGIYAYGVAPKRQDVENEISRYLNARIYTDRATGLREIKLIRPDYTVGNLVTISEADIIGTPDLTLPHRAAAFNTFEISFRDRTKDYEIAFLTAYDEAHVAAYGTRRAEEALEYPWVTSRAKAGELAARDIRAQTAPGLIGSIRVSGLRTDFNEGTPFVLDLPSYGFANIVCRIDKIAERGPRDNSVTITFTEDIFGTEVSPVIVDDLPDGVDTETPASAANGVAIESPYYFAEQRIDIDTILEDDAGFGGVLSAAIQPAGFILGYEIWTDAGTGYVERAVASFTPGGTLSADVGRTDTEFKVSPISGLQVGLALIGNEWVRIDSISGGAEWTLTVGRGCLDTAPVAHTAGEYLFSSENFETDDREYTDGAVINIKQLPFSTSETLDIASAAAKEITFDSRAIRPYPPAQFQIEGSYADQAGSGTVTATYVARNRLLQVDEDYAEDHTDAAITAEVGTTYYARAEAFDVDDNNLGTFIASNIGAVLTYDFDLSLAPVGAYSADLSIASVRDGYESFTRPKIRVTLSGATASAGNEQFNDTADSNDAFNDGATNDTFDDTE